MRLLKSMFLVLSAAVILGGTAAMAVMDPPVVDPPTPQEGDSITLAVNGAAENTCYYLDGYTFDRVGDTFYVNVLNHYSGTVCLFIYVPWGYEFELGVLEPGTYYYQAWESVGDSHTGSFTVADCTPCLSGDLNGSGQVNISDVTTVVDHLFRGGYLPCPEAADIDGSGDVNVSDLTYLIAYLMRGGPPPVPC